MISIQNECLQRVLKQNPIIFRKKLIHYAQNFSQMLLKVKIFWACSLVEGRTHTIVVRGKCCEVPACLPLSFSAHNIPPPFSSFLPLPFYCYVQGRQAEAGALFFQTANTVAFRAGIFCNHFHFQQHLREILSITLRRCKCRCRERWRSTPELKAFRMTPALPRSDAV